MMGLGVGGFGMRGTQGVAIHDRIGSRARTVNYWVIAQHVLGLGGRAQIPIPDPGPR